MISADETKLNALFAFANRAVDRFSGHAGIEPAGMASVMTLENKAAILALSIYAGHWRFEQFTGQVGTKSSQADPSITRHIALGGRQDLRLHFIVSAGIKVISDSGISFAAGEFKELLDALSGGNGFSFADLAADRAGTHFAKMAAGRDFPGKNIYLDWKCHAG